MRRLLCTSVLVALLPGALRAQSYYDQQRQNREYQRLHEATQRAYSVPSRPAPVSTYQAPAPAYSTPASSSYYAPSRGGNGNDAAQQLADQWRRNAGHYTPEEQAALASQRAATAEANRRYAEQEARRVAAEKEARAERERDARLDKYYSRLRRSPEHVRQDNFDSVATIHRRTANAAGIDRNEREVYAAWMNPFNTAPALPAAGQQMVLAAMQAHRTFLEQRNTASYETLLALVDAFQLLPLSTLEQAAFLTKRFRNHRADLQRVELRAMNFFYGAEFSAAYRYLRSDDGTSRRMEARWQQIYAQNPTEALAALQAVPDPRYNPLACWAAGCGDWEKRLGYYSLLLQVPTPDPDRWLAIVPDPHWEDWKKTWPTDFLVKLLESQPNMVLAISKRDRELKTRPAAPAPPPSTTKW